MLIKFPSLEEDLDIIAKSLDAGALADESPLQKFVFKLRKIDRNLTTRENNSSYKTIEKKKKIVATLAKRCEELKQRHLVLSFAERAEKLEVSSPFLSDEEIHLQATKLTLLIDAFCKKKKPSTMHMKYLRFAKKLLANTLDHRLVIIKQTETDNLIPFREHSPGEISLDDFALAESLYELAEKLFNGEISQFKTALEKDFSRASLKEMSFHIQNCGGKITSYATHSSRLLLIRGLIGFAHTITDYYVEDTPYPSTEEINDIFLNEIF